MTPSVHDWLTSFSATVLDLKSLWLWTFHKKMIYSIEAVCRIRLYTLFLKFHIYIVFENIILILLFFFNILSWPHIWHHGYGIENTIWKPFSNIQIFPAPVCATIDQISFFLELDKDWYVQQLQSYSLFVLLHFCAPDKARLHPFSIEDVVNIQSSLFGSSTYGSSRAPNIASKRWANWFSVIKWHCTALHWLIQHHA